MRLTAILQGKIAGGVRVRTERQILGGLGAFTVAAKKQRARQPACPDSKAGATKKHLLRAPFLYGARSTEYSTLS